MSFNFSGLPPNSSPLSDLVLVDGEWGPAAAGTLRQGNEPLPGSVLCDGAFGPR